MGVFTKKLLPQQQARCDVKNDSKNPRSLALWEPWPTGLAHVWYSFVGQITSGTKSPKLVEFPGLEKLVSFSVLRQSSNPGTSQAAAAAATAARKRSPTEGSARSLISSLS